MITSPVSIGNVAESGDGASHCFKYRLTTSSSLGFCVALCCVCWCLWICYVDDNFVVLNASEKSISVSSNRCFRYCEFCLSYCWVV